MKQFLSSERIFNAHSDNETVLWLSTKIKCVFPVTDSMKVPGLPLSPFHSWSDAFVWGSVIAAPLSVSSHRYRLRCHRHAVNDKHTSHEIHVLLWNNGILQETNCSFRPLLAGFVCELRICARQISHHLNHFHYGVDAQVIEEGEEVFLHLDAVVIHLSYSENTHLALPPHL